MLIPTNQSSTLTKASFNLLWNQNIKGLSHGICNKTDPIACSKDALVTSHAYENMQNHPYFSRHGSPSSSGLYQDGNTSSPVITEVKHLVLYQSSDGSNLLRRGKCSRRKAGTMGCPLRDDWSPRLGAIGSAATFNKKKKTSWSPSITEAWSVGEEFVNVATARS